MPPILSILGVDDLDKDSLDFGTIIVYTCKDSVSASTPKSLVETLVNDRLITSKCIPSFLQCTVSKVPPESVFEGEQAIFTPPAGWSEEIGFVQNFSQQGVKFQNA